MTRARWWVTAFCLLACQATPVAPPPKPAPSPVAAKPAHNDAAENHRRAVALSNAGDASVKVNVEEAIARYQQALQLEPNNVDVLWKLSRAHDRKEDWVAVAATLERASQLEPQVANYAHWRGHALVLLAQESGSVERPPKEYAAAYEAAREPLTSCLKLDAKLADCAFLLGQVEEATEHAQAAAERYMQAIANDPLQARSYLSLALLYRVYKQEKQAEMVLVQGMQVLEANERNRAELASMAVLLATLSARRYDTASRAVWLEKAEELAPEHTPALQFEIGALHVEPSVASASPASKEKAVRLLTTFSRRVCRGAAAAKYKQHCERAHSLLEQATSPYVRSVTAKSAPAVVPLPSGMPQPKLARQGVRDGNTFTVWGAAYYLRNPHLQREVMDKPIMITGFVTKTNLMQAPRCVVHRAGEADPDNCYAEIPAFWLGDYPDAPEEDCIKVMGFASTYSQILEAIRQADSVHAEVPYTDAFWGQVIPNPLPAAGAKLRVRGNYGRSFAKASSGAEMDSVMGLLDYTSSDVLQHAPQLATLPGVKRAKPAPVKYEIMPHVPFPHGSDRF